MAYLEYDSSLPDGSTQAVLEVAASTRQNLDALVDALVMGGVYRDVNMTVTGDADQPSSVLYERNPSQLRMDIVWNVDGNPDTITYHSSGDSGGTWDVVGTKTVTWDADGNATQTDWS